MVSLCPSRFCSARNPMQELVTKSQASAVEEDALEGAIICSDCGCVYIRDPKGRDRVLGTLRKAGASYKWISDYRRPNV